MNQDNKRIQEQEGQDLATVVNQSRQAMESTKRLKRRMIVVIIGMLVFMVVAIAVINMIDSTETPDPDEKVTIPHIHGNFYEPDYDYNIMNDEEYLDLDRIIYYHDARTGIMKSLTDKNLPAQGPAVNTLYNMIEAIIYGNADAYNDLFSQSYYKDNNPEREFTMQQVYDIHITIESETDQQNAAGGIQTEYIFTVEYKIRRNNGTFRTDIGSDSSRTQIIVLSDKEGKDVLIDRIVYVN